MSGLDKIIQQIQSEAKQSADEMIAKAKEKAAEISAQAEKDASAKVAAIEERAKADVQNSIASAKSAADLARRREILAAKQEIIGQAIEEAQQSVYALPDSDYFALILKMIKKYSLAQDGEIRFSKKDLGRLPASFEDSLSKSAQGKLALSKEPADIGGGFVLLYGGVEENCSIEALFYAARADLQDKVQELLFQ